MLENDLRVKRLLSEATRGRYSRRQIIQRGMALGLSASAIGAALGRATGVSAQDATPAASPAASPMASPAVSNVVPILNRPLSTEEVAAEIAREGEVTVGNWTYTANEQLIARFQQYVKDTFGADIRLNYTASQSPSTYLVEYFTARQAGDPSPYDVMAIEENYWAEVQAQSQAQGEALMEDFLPSPLIPNADRVDDLFKHVPTAIGFQASASPGIVYNTSEAEFITNFPDLADDRLKGRVILYVPTDITAGGFLLGLAAALGKDYQNMDQMKETIDFAVDRIGPNVIKYTNSSTEVQQLLESGVALAASFWNSMARLIYLNGKPDVAFLVPETGVYLANGYMWIPKNAPHPVLAQVFINWRLSDDAQLPGDDWGITQGAWSELHEGLLGPSYEPLIPEWFRADYYTYYPTVEQLTTRYKPIDWDYYAANSTQWFDYYSQRLGLG